MQIVVFLSCFCQRFRKIRVETRPDGFYEDFSAGFYCDFMEASFGLIGNDVNDGGGSELL